MLTMVLGIMIYADVVWLITLPAVIDRLNRPSATRGEVATSIFLYISAPVIPPLILLLGVLLIAIGFILAGVIFLVLLSVIALAVPSWLIMELFFILMDAWIWSGNEIFDANEALFSMLRSVYSSPGKIVNKTAPRSNINR